MKTTQPSRSAYFKVYTLIGLAAVGIALTAIVVYGADQGNGSLQVLLRTEASQKHGFAESTVRFMGTTMDMTWRPIPWATFLLLVGLRRQPAMRIVTQ